MKPNQTVSRKTGLASKAERQTLQTTRKEESEPQCASLLGHIGTRKNVLVDLFVWPEKLQHAQHALSRKRYTSFFSFALNQIPLPLSRIEEHFNSVCVVGGTLKLHHWFSFPLVLNFFFYFIVIRCKTKGCDQMKTIENGWRKPGGNNLPPP